MKQTIKRALAVFVAALLATMGPVGALSEGIVNGAGASVSGDVVPGAGASVSGDAVPGAGSSVSGDVVPGAEEPVVSEDIEPSAKEVILELGGEEGEVADETSDSVSGPFEQVVNLDDAVFAVTAAAGVVPEGATVKVEVFDSESAAPAVEAAVGEAGVFVHRPYRLEFVDGENRAILPDQAQGAVVVRVEGLELPSGTRVAVYDETLNGAYEIEARVNEDAIAFALVDAVVYDIFTIEPPTETREEAPVEGETEESAQQPTEGETEEPTEQSAEGDAEEESTDEVIEEPEEVEGEAIQPVSVVFDAMPETATVTVYSAATEEAPATEAMPAQEDGSFALLPGEYTYTAEAVGYVSLENVPFTVTGDEQPLLLSFALEAVPEETPEPVAFEQSQTVNGVIVTVRAEPGVFPEGAELNVQRVPVYKQRQADAAVEEVRDENQNVAVSYTFDIKVIDPATREELQPAEGQTVNVSFALAEVADENLETSVYHIDEGGAAQKLDVTQEDEVTAVVETEGFSLYTVEFTYNKLEYVLPGDTSVPMSEILSTLGLTGAVEAVEISDTTLFSASNATGEWIVTAHQAFSTTEWMKVTINGVTYEIAVTDDNPSEIEIASWDDLKNNTLAATTTTSNGVTTVTLKSCIKITNELTINSDTNILDLNGYGIRYVGSELESTIYLKGGVGAALTLQDSNPGRANYYITLEDGRGTAVSNIGTECATCIRITGGYLTGGCAQYGSGVNIQSSNFTMTGGTICGNKGDEGGGVFVDGASTFTMTGGRISHNIGSVEGGGVLAYGSFTMTGGNISDNTGGYGGGVFIYGTFFLLSGTIAENRITVSGNVNVEGYKFYRKTGCTVADACTAYEFASVSTNATNGTVTANAAISDTLNFGEATYYIVGKTVTLTLTPTNVDYEPGTVTVKKTGDSETVNVSGTGDTRTFTMPNDDVTVSAVFTEIDFSAIDTAAKLRLALARAGSYRLAADISGVSDLSVSAAVTLDLNGYTISGTGTNGVLSIGSGGNLTLKDTSAAQTGNITGGDSARGVYVNGGTFTLQGGTITGKSDNGGGVHVASGTAIMNGGAISGCGVNSNNTGKGGGVYVAGGSFTLNDGTISNNSAYSGGGLYLAGGTAAMNGGMITNCSAVGQGGGITTAIATFTLNGGMIVGNRVTSGNRGGGGIYVGYTIYVSGSPVVKNNQLRDYIDDIRLYSGINIIGALKPGATLRISAKSSGDTVASLKENSTYVITDDDALAFRSSDDTLVGEASSDGQQVTFKQKETETYDVTITAGTGMTKTTSSGAIIQTVNASSAITSVVFEANEGYYFPLEYRVDAVNGISVERSSSKITVTGTPTADTEITLLGATEWEAAVFFDNGGDTYTIESVEGWDLFCYALETQGSGFFQNKTVVLGADIGTTDDPVTRMAGGTDKEHRFKGTFDGNGHTLTVAYNCSDNYCGPFRQVQGGVITNLTVEGIINVSGGHYTGGIIGVAYTDTATNKQNIISNCVSRVRITTNNSYVGGIAGKAYNLTIENCTSSAVIESSHSGQSQYGGFIGSMDNTVTITGCIFNGEIKGEKANTCGGFIGANTNQTVTITNCLFAPSEITVVEKNCATFACHGDNATTNVINSYYTQSLGETQGKQVSKIIAGENVTLSNAGTATVYNTSGITSYGTGIEYGGVYYAVSEDSVRLNLNHSDRDGYTFTGYTASAGALTGAGNPYTLTMPDADVTVTATYSANAYTVHFDANGGSGDAMSDQAFTYGAAQALTANTYMPPTGYAFTGWNTVAVPTEQTPGTAYTDRQSVNNLTAENNGTVILYAQWTQHDYSLTIAGTSNGTVTAKVGEMDNATTAHYNDTVTLTVTPAAGCVIGTVSYNDGSDHTIEPVDGVYSFTMPEDDVTVRATWLEIPEVTYLITIPDELDFGALTVPEDGTEPVYAEASFTVTAEAILGLENTCFRMNVYVSPEAGKTDFAIVNKADPDVGFTYEIKDLDEGAPLCGFKAVGSHSGTARLDQRQLRQYSLPQMVGEYSGRMVFYSCVEIEGNED